MPGGTRAVHVAGKEHRLGARGDAGADAGGGGRRVRGHGPGARARVPGVGTLPVRAARVSPSQVFEDVEECPICYTVLHLVNNSLPRMACHTCRNKFHSACLSKWFNTSNKSTCPLCQSPWYS